MAFAGRRRSRGWGPGIGHRRRGTEVARRVKVLGTFHDAKMARTVGHAKR